MSEQRLPCARARCRIVCRAFSQKLGRENARILSDQWRSGAKKARPTQSPGSDPRSGRCSHQEKSPALPALRISQPLRHPDRHCSARFLAPPRSEQRAPSRREPQKRRARMGRRLIGPNELARSPAQCWPRGGPPAPAYGELKKPASTQAALQKGG